MESRLLAALAVLALAALIACGVPGVPQPPSLELPRTVSDLTATRKGDRVALSWRTPNQTTDHGTIKHLGVTRICRAVDVIAPAQCVETVGTLAATQTPPATAASFTDTLPKQLEETHPAGFASYAVEVENWRGRTAGLSNSVIVPLAPTLPPPGQLSARVTSDGVEISAVAGHPPAGLAFAYHLYRRSQGANVEVDLGELSAHDMQQGLSLLLLDRNIEWEKTYFYKIAAVTSERIQGQEEQIAGNDSPEIEVFVHDVFPPAIPTGLEAISAGTPQQPFIDLSWTPNTESDLAGYNVFRREEGGEPKKINRELVTSPTYRDTGVQPGHRYWYSVSAVDLRGNESGRSPETSEAIPQ